MTPALRRGGITVCLQACIEPYKSIQCANDALLSKHVAYLFLLMTILSQSFFTLVGSHLVAFSFLSAGHSCIY